MVPTTLMVDRIVRALDTGEILLDSVNRDKDRTEITAKFKETVTELKSWQTSWAVHSQVIPDEGILVIALAVTLATSGTGGAFFKLTGALSEMASAGYTALL